MPVTLPETIVRRRCAALIPYARNARTHSDQQVAQIADSIREFGFTNPVLIDEEDGIIAGHGRVLAAHLLGLDEVPCIVLTHLSPTQRRAYVIADNKLALNAGWDLEMLSLEIGEIGEAGFDLNLTGFDEFELGELFAERTQGRTDPDDAPEPPAHPVSEPSDLWVLGRHRLLCGDSTVATDVERVLGVVAPHLMVTDPPYGVNYDPAWRNQAGRSINGTTQRIATGTVIKPEVSQGGRFFTLSKTRARAGRTGRLRRRAEVAQPNQARHDVLATKAQCRGIDTRAALRGRQRVTVLPRYCPDRGV